MLTEFRFLQNIYCHFFTFKTNEIISYTWNSQCVHITQFKWMLQLNQWTYSRYFISYEFGLIKLLFFLSAHVFAIVFGCVNYGLKTIAIILLKYFFYYSVLVYSIHWPFSMNFSRILVDHFSFHSMASVLNNTALSECCTSISRIPNRKINLVV